MMADLHDKAYAEEFYEQRYEEGYMEDWDDLKKKKVREILKDLGLPDTGKALDFGCGNGVFTHLLKTELPGWDIFGVEISKTAVVNASRKFPDCKFFTADEGNNYKNQFDLIFSHHVIEHVQELEPTFGIINDFLKPESSQLHILPCGNEGSYEFNIVKLKKNGIEREKENRFFFEEPGHLRRLSTDEVITIEKKFGFHLVKEFYSNQEAGAINWITKSSPRFVRKLTDPNDAVSAPAKIELSDLRKKLLPLTYTQFPYSKYWLIKSKWKKSLGDYLKMAVLFLPAQIAKITYDKWQAKAEEEWNKRKQERSGSEMFLFFKRP